MNRRNLLFSQQKQTFRKHFKILFYCFFLKNEAHFNMETLFGNTLSKKRTNLGKAYMKMYVF